jgi:hypothetical protein
MRVVTGGATCAGLKVAGGAVAGGWVSGGAVTGTVAAVVGGNVGFGLGFTVVVARGLGTVVTVGA